jgi:hypothetical protein
MRLQTVFAWIVVLCGCGSSAIGATITTFTNLGSWTGAAGSPIIIENFSDSTLVSGLSVTNFGAGSIAGGVFNGPLNNGNKTIAFGFSPSTFAIGGDFNITVSGNNSGVRLEVDFQGGGSQIVATLNTAFNGFFGLVSDTAISQLRLVHVQPPTAAEGFTLDNLRFLGPADPAPEPASLLTWSLLGGAAYVATRLRRRARVANATLPVR